MNDHPARHILIEPDGTMPDKLVRMLMRQHGVTIRELAARMDITMKRVRQVRKDGVKGHCGARDWVQAITGRDPGCLATVHDHCSHPPIPREA